MCTNRLSVLLQHWLPALIRASLCSQRKVSTAGCHAALMAIKQCCIYLGLHKVGGAWQVGNTGAYTWRLGRTTVRLYICCVLAKVMHVS
jgi:hypothetical protein